MAPGKSAVVLTPDALLAAGADVVAAYSDAVDEAKHLARVDSWIASTRELSSHTGDKDPALRILRPTSIVQLANLDSAQARPAIPALNALDPVWVTAVREGITFQINTIRQCAALRAGLSTVRV